jgi:hypothetical protein
MLDRPGAFGFERGHQLPGRHTARQIRGLVGEQGNEIAILGFGRRPHRPVSGFCDGWVSVAAASVNSINRLRTQRRRATTELVEISDEVEHGTWRVHAPSQGARQGMGWINKYVGVMSHHLPRELGTNMFRFYSFQ